MATQWNYKELNRACSNAKEQLANELSISPILAKLLIQRGITTFEEARSFFRPDITQLHDPFLMKDMDKAVQRLTKAMKRNEKIMIYGDYDVDGTTSVALVYRFLVKIYSNITYYIPDRYAEGYGISYKGIDTASKENISLVISLDCGIKAIEKVKYAQSLGIDFIICDHHTPDDQIPPAVAVLDPKRPDCNYPYQHLSGCGVGYKFMQAFALQNEIDQTKHLHTSLDLVALSIASDIVPITGENRILAFEGLKQINNNPSIGVKAIIEVCELKNRELTISDIVFKIGPRINASGRMTLASEAVELLVANNYKMALQKSKQINQYNNDRKSLDKNTTEAALSMIESNAEYEKRKSIVVYHPDWHKGVIGIVASRLTEEYYKPTIVLSQSNGYASGSARSVQGFDIYKAIESCKNLLENFGGHMYAAGLTLKAENVPAFTIAFEKYVAKHITPAQTIPQIEIDATLQFKDITPKFYRILKQFSPFGPGNMKPIFESKKVYDYNDNSRLVGKGQKHLKLALIDDSCEEVINGIGFRMHKYNEHLKSPNPLDICYTLEENTFNGNTTIQLLIKDIKRKYNTSTPPL